MKLAVDLGKQYGPLPLGAWIVVVGAGLGIAYYTRRSGDEPVIIEDTAGDSDVGTGVVGGWVPTTPGNTGDSVTGPPQTNDEWARRAKLELIARNHDSLLVDTAINKYLAASPLSGTEQAVIALALGILGPPPQALPPTETPEPPPTTLPKPPAPNTPKLISVRRDSVTIEWKPVPGAASYIAYRSTPGVSRTVAETPTGTRHTFISLQPNTTYWFSVASVNAQGVRSGSTSGVIRVRTAR